jgi:hypothetical protein
MQVHIRYKDATKERRLAKQVAVATAISWPCVIRSTMLVLLFCKERKSVLEVVSFLWVNIYFFDLLPSPNNLIV